MNKKLSMGGLSLLLFLLLVACAPAPTLAPHTPVLPTATSPPPPATPTLVPPAATQMLPTSTPSPVPAGTKPIVIDTDMAIDDWMAILYLLQRSDVAVQVITVTGTGEAHCNPGTRNASGLLALAGNADIPVACGRETPLRGNHTFPESWREAVDTLLGLSLPSNPYPPSNQTAVELLYSIIQSSPQKVVLVTLGPLTNVAEALQSKPSLVHNLEMIYVMGGAVDVPGNIQASGVDTNNLVAEWNFYVDPHAAAVVFESGVPITLVPLDATNHAPLAMAFYRRLEADLTTPEADFVYQVLTQMQDFIRSGGYFFWDPLTAAVATDESLCTFRRQTLKVIEEEGSESGRTLRSEDGISIRVCVAADGPRFETVFLDALNGRFPQRL